jgi:hypothetical protein
MDAWEGWKRGNGKEQAVGDDDERPNWREIDRKRDRSRHSGRRDEGFKADDHADRWQSGRVKEALDRLFKGEKGTVEHDKLLNKVNAVYGTDRFPPAVKRYTDKYGLPDDVRTLILFLDSRDAAVCLGVIEKLKSMSGALAARQKDDVRRKLSIVALTDRSQEVRDAAQDVLEEGGGE